MLMLRQLRNWMRSQKFLSYMLTKLLLGEHVSLIDFSKTFMLKIIHCT